MGTGGVTLRVVLDTNVIASALVFQTGRLTWLRNAWSARKIVPLVSRGTIDELLRVLAYPKFDLGAEEIEALLGDYLPFVELVHPASAEEVPDPTDASDRIFVELAVAGEADCIVTADRGLLESVADSRVRVITPAELRSLLEGTG